LFDFRHTKTKNRQFLPIFHLTQSKLKEILTLFCLFKVSVLSHRIISFHLDFDFESSSHRGLFVRRRLGVRPLYDFTPNPQMTKMCKSDLLKQFYIFLWSINQLLVIIFKPQLIVIVYNIETLVRTNW